MNNSLATNHKSEPIDPLAEAYTAAKNTFDAINIRLNDSGMKLRLAEHNNNLQYYDFVDSHAKTWSEWKDAHNTVNIAVQAISDRNLNIKYRF